MLVLLNKIILIKEQNDAQLPTDANGNHALLRFLSLLFISC